MTSGKIKAVLFIIVFLLIVAVVASWFVSRDEQTAPADVPAAEPAPTDTQIVLTPEPTAVLLTPVPRTPAAPKPTPAPTPVPTPPPTPAPTPEPLFPVTPETTADFTPGETVAGGRLESQTVSGMQLIVNWSAVAQSAEEVRLDVEVALVSGALHTGEGGRALMINAGGQYVTLQAPLIDYDGTTLATHVLGTQSFTVKAPAGTTTATVLEVNWQFNGSYGGTSIPSLECGGSISLPR